MSEAIVHQHSFPSMGTEIELLLMGGTDASAREAFEEAEELAGEWMRTFSRFDPESELSRLNAASGEPVVVSSRMFQAVEAAIEAAQLTGGLFNPLVLPALVAYGYDRTFEELEVDSATSPRSYKPAAVEEMRVDAGQRAIQLPRDSALDLGGIAKGLYADELAGRLAEWQGGIVSAGGDMRVWGEGPDDGGWAVGVEDPGFSEDDIALVLLSDGGVATSGTNRRQWRRGGAPAHHLIDPRSGAPAAAIDRTVTIIAPTAVLAEIGSTAYFIDPKNGGSDTLSEHLWAMIAVDLHQLISFVEFDPEGSFDVYFNQ